jgi:L-alanine-DL-glutamate epimerase-like enolase superfamily enzyme
MSKIRKITLRRLRLPLSSPYRLSYRTFLEFEPYVVQLEDDAGRHAFADGHVSPGSSSETRDGAWAFCVEQLAALPGLDTAEAKGRLLARFLESKVAVTAMVCALESLEGSTFLDVSHDTVLPLLVPVSALEPAAIAEEIDRRIAAGFKVFKVKVGKDVDADLARVRAIQQAAAGRAGLRLDANRAFSRDDAVSFVSGLDPDCIELFEQPCDADDWEANAAVAAASPVPLMLDEPICSLSDIDRAATLPNVGYCKLKLKRFGSMERLAQGLVRVRSQGMRPVLGDGLGSEIHNWMEACVARTTIDNAGEFNGFLKHPDKLFRQPLGFERGAIVMPAGYRPELDSDAVDRLTVERRDFPAG